MHRNFLVTGAILCGLAVVLGAFGAHGLQQLTTDIKIIQGYQTGVQYQMWHSLALIIVAVLFASGFSQRMLKLAAISFISGILLFSGSLYLLAYLKIQQSSLVKAVGPVTPLGGVLFITGWLFLVIAFMKKKGS